MHTTCFRSLLLTAACLAAVPFGASAVTVDNKVTNGAECQPYSTTTLPSELSFRANGLKNISANSEYVVCNLMIDADSPGTWTDTNPARVSVNFHASAPGVVHCELYVGSNLLGSPVSYTGDRALAASELNAITFYNASASNVVSPEYTHVPASLYCRLPPGASLISLMLVETSISTDG